MPYRVRNEGVALRGFAELQRALREIDRKQSAELRKRLRNVGQDVAKVARNNVTHESGRHFGSPAIEDSIRVAISRNSAAVYSTAPHGGVQNVGGRVGHGAILKRADVSQYMNRAVAQTREEVARELDGLLDWLVDTFERG